MMNKYTRNSMLITIVLFIVGYWLYSANHWSYQVVVATLAEAPAEEAEFVAYCQSEAASRIAVHSVYDDTKTMKSFYMWFDSGYQPANLRAEPGIDVDIAWEKGEPAQEPLLYCITLINDRQKNPSVAFWEDGHIIHPLNF